CGLPRPLAACRHQTSPNWFGSRGSLYLAAVHGVVKDLAELGHVLVLQVLAFVLGDLLDLALVALRDDHGLDPRAPPPVRPGTIPRLIPARCAASDFSLMPPIGSTWPVSVISPVIATSLATGPPLISDASAVAIATPADGPSFGTAPDGTWMWMSCLANQSSGRSGASSDWWPRTHDSAASADSRITSPSWPVIVSLPEPGIAVASMKRTSPPTGVHASPVATPGSFVRRRCSAQYLRGPSSSRARFPAIFALPSTLPSRASRATFRHTVPIWRSRLRTPASRVYSSAIAFSAEAGNSICDGFSPFSSIWRGTRYWRAMWSFSSSVYPESWITSMRSWSGAGTVSSRFAVAMKRTSERSNSRSR